MIKEEPLSADEQLSIKDFDDDSCDNEESKDVCSTNYKLLDEKKVDHSYILHTSGTTDTNFNLAVATSNNLCEVYHFDNNRLAKINDFKEREGRIVGIQFSSENNNILYSASTAGNIKLWDLRLSEKLVLQFKDTTIEEGQITRQIMCFDVSLNNRLLAAGTELYEGEAFILFWDVRNVNLLGGYWESHSDNITQMKFHPRDVNKLISGSVDGLINIYDLKQKREDDAFLDCLNTESSVERLQWFTHTGRDCISCITNTIDVQLWKTEDVEPYAHFRRPEIAKAIKRKSDTYSYLAGMHTCKNDELFLLAGSNWHDGEYSRVVFIDNNNLVPKCILKENKQRIRSSWYNQYHNVLVTGGEKGILNVWHVDLT